MPKRSVGARRLPSNKHAKFRQVALKRVNKAIENLQLVRKLANRSLYDYSTQDAQKIIGALEHEMDAIRTAFVGSARAKKDQFTF
jgi:hypothetical protein